MAHIEPGPLLISISHGFPEGRPPSQYVVKGTRIRCFSLSTYVLCQIVLYIVHFCGSGHGDSSLYTLYRC